MNAAKDKKAGMGRIRVRLVRSLSGRREKQRQCVRGLGLRRMHHQVEVEDSPQNRGMINAVSFMLEVEEVS